MAGQGFNSQKTYTCFVQFEIPKILPENFAIVSIGRRDRTEEQYRNEVLESIKNYSRFDIDEKVWQNLSERIFYKRFDFVYDNGYIELSSF